MSSGGKCPGNGQAEVGAAGRGTALETWGVGGRPEGLQVERKSLGKHCEWYVQETGGGWDTVERGQKLGGGEEMVPWPQGQHKHHLRNCG